VEAGHQSPQETIRAGRKALRQISIQLPLQGFREPGLSAHFAAEIVQADAEARAYGQSEGPFQCLGRGLGPEEFALPGSVAAVRLVPITIVVEQAPFPARYAPMGGLVQATVQVIPREADFGGAFGARRAVKGFGITAHQANARTGGRRFFSRGRVSAEKAMEHVQYVH